MNIEEKLSRLNRQIDTSEYKHLQIKDQAGCSRCSERPCVNFCPAAVYIWEEGKLILRYENCLECGSCRWGCPFDNLQWSYPRGGFGIRYRYG